MKTILVIEDDQVTQKAYQELLTKEGYAVIPATNNTEAQSQLQFNTFVPDLIVLDIMLPGDKNGIEILTDIRSKHAWKSILVIILTNLDTEKERAFTLGAAAYLVKANTSIVTILSKVKQLIGEA